MKKLFLVLALIFMHIYMFSQISISGLGKSYFKTFSNIDYFIVFNGIDANSSLKFTGTYSTINWYKFSDPVNSISNQDENFNIENATGYILEVDGQKTTIWVIDYQDYIPTFNSFTPEFAPSKQCDELKLFIDANIPEIQYKSVNGLTYKIDREFVLTYQTKEWNSEWKDKEIKENLLLPQTEITITDAPLCDTKFKIEGDQFARDLQIAPLPNIESALYSAVAVECHITTSAAIRKELNEDERPDAVSTLKGSAPLEIAFESNANIPVAEFYRWEIFRENQLLFIRNDQDQRYTFSEAGKYTVKLTASNANCSYVDSVFVEVSVSDIEVPYAFTPNGDLINDEFRVAYRSLKTFRCWVYNRWGRKVFYWTDPQKGWDGKINGREAAEGGYVYIVEAEGTDGVIHKRKGVVNLLRGKAK